MSENKIIPTYDIYKKLDADIQFECWTLNETHNPYDTSQAHRHNYFEIFFFDKNGGNHEIDFRNFSVKKNMLHFICPEQVHLLKRKQNVNGFVISFTKEFCSLNSVTEIRMDDFPFFNNTYSTPFLELKTNKSKNEILDLIKKLKEEFSSENEDKANILSSYLNILLIQLKRIYQQENEINSENSAKNELIRKFKLLIEKNFIQKKSVAEYAELLHISAGHLNDTTQNSIGKSASELIHERIILEAKRLLYHSEKSIKEISYSLNYDDPSYFAKFFKNHTFTTPDEFRKQIREKYH